MQNALQQEKLRLAETEKEIEREQEALLLLEKERDKLMVKAEFKAPGIKGKVKRRIIDEFGNEVWIDVDLENEDFDDNMSV